ncbi:CCHamide-1 receptor [Carabus blaptoides fortunei]
MDDVDYFSTTWSTTTFDLDNFTDNISSTVYPNGTSYTYEYSERIETYLVPVVFFIIFIVGVLGNGTLIIIFVRHRAMRNVPNIYILSLALADLLVIVTCVPFTSTVYTVESWPWGEAVCKLSETVKDISIGVSVFTLTALSADRFFAIVDPLRKLHATGGGRRATRVTVTIAALIWLLAIICAIPAGIGTYVRPFVTDKNKVLFVVCYPFPVEWGNEYAKANVLARFLILYAIPLTVIAIFYALMARHLVLSTKNVLGEVQGQQRQIRVRKKVAVTVLTFVVVFAICFLPSHIFMLWFYYNTKAQEEYNGFWHYLRIVGFCLTFLNSCVNPVALYCVSGTFRKHFNRYLLCQGNAAARTRCNTCQGQRATSMSLTTSRRQYSVLSRRAQLTSSTNRRPMCQETSVTLIGNGNEHACSKIIKRTDVLDKMKSIEE